MQLARLGGPDDKTYHAVHELFTQRELEGSFFRLTAAAEAGNSATTTPTTAAAYMADLLTCEISNI
jgi:hypothetical protein